MSHRLLIWLIILLIGIGAAVVYTPHYPSQMQFSIPWGVTMVDGEYVVLGRLYENDEPNIDVHRADSLWVASVASLWSRGPWYGRVEFYDKIEYSLSVYNTHHNADPRPNRDQYPLIKEALQRYFDEHDLLPVDGYDTRTSYSYLPHESRVSVLRIAVFLTLTAILAWILDWLWGCIRKRAWHQKMGCCIHCGYDCTELDSQTCPECGQNHAFPEHA